jgi:acetylornithine deacetylase/succinyl-diaminopimelate desuccinylase-like protein
MTTNTTAEPNSIRPGSRPSDQVIRQLRDAVRAGLPSVLSELSALVRIPSVSADEAATATAAIQATAEASARLFREAGAAEVRLLTVPGGRPAVLARYPAPEGMPTVLLYAHHDVQPPGEESHWDSPPFEPVERSGRLFGRGAADDKAGIAAHLAAVRAFGGKPPVGVTVLIEGEEEIGSPTLSTFLDVHRELLRADVIVLADSTNWAVGQPALTTSLRGLADCTVEVATSSRGLHSGMYGGAVPDALTALCRLIATLHDHRGEVAVAGLTGSSADPLDLTEERLREEAGLLPGVQLIGAGSLTSRLWTKPALAVIGLDTTRTAEASNTLIPSARAKLSLRLAPGQDAEAAYEALVEHLRARAPWGAQVTVTRGEVAAPYRIIASGPHYDAARTAFATAWGVPPVEIGVGGSIPFVAEFAEAFPAASILVTGVEDPDSRAHGANESLHLGEFEKVCLAEALLLAELAASAGTPNTRN